MLKIIYAVIRECMPEDFVDNLVFAPGEYEIMLFQVPAVIEVNGKMEEYPEHTCILYKPGQHIHYHAVSGKLIYSWIRFDCDEPLFTEEDYLPFGVPVFCPDYDYYLQYFQMVANENYWQHPSSEYVLPDLMEIILHRLHDHAFLTDSSRHRNALIRLRNEIYKHPEYNWTLESMAKKVNLSTRAIQKAYLEFARISCINDVIESRIAKAKAFLTRTSDSVQNISSICGYRNVEHFCRQFKSHEGITPGQYRKMHQR